MSNARKVDWTLAEYHADTTHVSHSGLKLVYQDPAKYYYERLLKQPRESKPWFEDGQRFEDALLGGPDGSELGSNLVVIPENALASNGARSGTKWKKFAEANQGKVLIKRDDEVIRWVDAIKAHDAARELLEAVGTRQETILWHDDLHGVDVRCRPDFLHLGAEVCVDVKSTRTSAALWELSNEIGKFKYHRQADLYSSGIEELYGRRPTFIFIFVSKEPPYRVECVELNDEFLRLAHEQNQEALATYAKCAASNQWLPSTHGRLTKIGPPAYLKTENSWRVQDGQ